MKFHTPVSGDKALDLPLAFGHFLPWYILRAEDFPLPAERCDGIDTMPKLDDMRHWVDRRGRYGRTHLHQPEVKAYDSRDPAIIHWQIEQAQAYGISGLIINWYGKNSAENVITLHVIESLKEWNRQHPDRPFLYFISHDSQAQKESEGKKPVSMIEDFTYLRDHLINDAYLLRDGKPVLSGFPYEDNCADWRAALDEVFGEGGADLIWMYDIRGQGENACFPWVRPDDEFINNANPYPWFNPDNVGDSFLRNFYRHGNQFDHIEYLMAGVWPGFDDQLVSWAWSADPESPFIRPRVICREVSRGNTLDLTWQAYLDYLEQWAAGDPDTHVPIPLIQIITWNDYNEASTVEPTRDYGTKPLQQCKEAIMRAREIWSHAKGNHRVLGGTQRL